MAENTETKKLLYIETRSFNPLEITVKNNLVKLDNLNKIDSLLKITLQELIKSYDIFTGDFKLKISNIVVREGKIIAAVNNLGTKVILYPEVYDKTKINIPLYSPSVNFKLLLVKKK